MARRKTAQEIQEEERLEAENLLVHDNNPTILVDDLFSSTDNNKEKISKTTKIEKEPELIRFEDIRKYYIDYPEKGKQFTGYLPEELIRKLKSKVSEDDTTIKDLIRNLLVEHVFSDKELKEAYQKRNQ